jgi:hypothetical protein
MFYTEWRYWFGGGGGASKRWPEISFLKTRNFQAISF